METKIEVPDLPALHRFCTVSTSNYDDCPLLDADDYNVYRAGCSLFNKALDYEENITTPNWEKALLFLRCDACKQISRARADKELAAHETKGDSDIANPSEPIQCPACDDSFVTRQGFSRHARIHVNNGELIAYVKNPNADVHLQKYAYRLPDAKD